MVLKLKIWILLVLSFLFAIFLPVNAQEPNHLSKETREYLAHDAKMAEKIFKEKCTSCHSTSKALSRRAYQDWLLGITKRHGQPQNWLSDEEARTIFFHLIVHLEPQIKEKMLSQNRKSFAGWRFVITYLSGALAFSLFGITFSLAKIKSLRRRYFKRHRQLAHVSMIVATFHALYVLYFLVK